MVTGKISDRGIGHDEDPEHTALETPIECDHCHAKIPATVALSFEGSDYLYHFCGPPCVEAWRKARTSHDK